MSHIIDVEIYFAKVNDFNIDNLSLTTEERLALGKIKSPKRQKEWAISKWLRRKILSEKIGLPEEILIFDTHKSGKPFLSDPVTYYFNISHSYDWVVLALCRQCEIGIDIQKMDEHRNILGIAQHYFSSTETQELEHLQCDAQRELFYTLWTLKEAILKSKGYGIASNLSEYSFMLEDKRLALNQNYIQKTYLESYQLGHNYLCALALDYVDISAISIQAKSYRVKQDENPILMDLKNGNYQICNYGL